MTLIIYIKCADAIIAILDRKETNTSDVGQTTKKYYFPSNQEFLLALAGESIRIDTIVSDLQIDQSINSTTIRKKLYEIIEKSPILGTDNMSAGFLLIKDTNTFKFNNVWFSNSQKSIIEEDPPFKCYGEGATIADYLIRKFNFSELPWSTACQYLIAIMQDISKRVDSVGSIQNYGFDVIVFTNSGELKQSTINEENGLNGIQCDLKVNDDFDLPSQIQEKTDKKIESIEQTVVKSQEENVENLHELAKKGDLPIVVQTDKSVYTYGSDMIVTIINPYFITGTPIKLEIKNNQQKTVYKNIIPVDRKAKGIYQEIIRIEGEDWAQPGAEYKILAEYADKWAQLSIFTSDFGIAIELDQKVYSWTDKVYITIVAPDLVQNSDEIESIGDKPDRKITISTSKGKLENYRLEETRKDTGIFTGEIKLTGFSGHDATGDGNSNDATGKIEGTGPRDGKISCSNKDGITINLETPTKTVSGSALIRWNIGELQWLDASYPANGAGEVRVVDPDMNLDPEKIDEFEIKVWSDTDPIGIKLKVKETGNATGIFKSNIFFTTEEQSSDSKLKVSEGDTITAEYIDRTLPEPYSTDSELSISATTMIGTLSPPLERINASNPRLLDSFGQSMDEIRINQDVQITADLSNNQNIEQKFAYLIQITDEHGNQESLSSISGSLSSGQSFSPSLSWKPSLSGKYTAMIFVWESVDVPTALSAPLEITINVLEEEKKQKESTEPQLEKTIPPANRFPSKPIVSIPPGTSVPGCEKHDRCYLPSELIIRVNQTVIWNNDDTAAHTVTSGTPDGGSNGNFDSSLFMSGHSFAHKFTKKGIFSYFCMVHPWQTGVVVVE